MQNIHHAGLTSIDLVYGEADDFDLLLDAGDDDVEVVFVEQGAGVPVLAPSAEALAFLALDG